MLGRNCWLTRPSQLLDCWNQHLVILDLNGRRLQWNWLISGLIQRRILDVKSQLDKKFSIACTGSSGKGRRRIHDKASKRRHQRIVIEDLGLDHRDSTSWYLSYEEFWWTEWDKNTFWALWRSPQQLYNMMRGGNILFNPTLTSVDNTLEKYNDDSFDVELNFIPPKCQN